MVELFASIFALSLPANLVLYMSALVVVHFD